MYYFTDDVREEGNEFGRVRPCVCFRFFIQTARIPALIFKCMARRELKMKVRVSFTKQCSRMRILRFFSDFKKRDFLTFFELSCQKDVKSR